MNLDLPWHQYTYIAFDTETSGQFPLGDEIVELGLVVYKNGKVISQFNELFKPKKPMCAEVIAIHGITNEMVATSPPIESKLTELRSYFENSIVIAHHAPFDLGFLAWEFEKAKLSLPRPPSICTSLLSINLIRGIANHKLQTLIQHLNIQQEQAHRAHSDASACLQVALHCIALLGPEVTLQQVMSAQGKRLDWIDYSIQKLTANSPTLEALRDAILTDRSIDFVYDSGSHKGKVRRAKPRGLVRNPNGDFFVAFCSIDQKDKRFYLRNLKEACLAPLMAPVGLS